MRLKNDKWEKFCQLYVEDTYMRLDGGGKSLSEIYREAGYDGDPSNANHLMEKLPIRMRIKELKAQRLRDDGFSQDAIHRLILDELVGIVSATPTDVLQLVTDEPSEERDELIRDIEDAYGEKVLDFGSMIALPTKALSRETVSAIKSFKVTYDKVTGKINGVDVQMYDKNSAADKLAEIAGIKNSGVAYKAVDDIANDPEAISRAMELAMAIKLQRDKQAEEQ